MKLSKTEKWGIQFFIALQVFAGCIFYLAAAATGNPNDPLSPHDFGIYLFEEKNGEKTMTQLTVNVSAQNRAGGSNTSAAVGAKFFDFGVRLTP